MTDNMDNNLYLDACSTTPPLATVIEEVSRVQSGFWANSSSIHLHGIESANILEKSRISIANKLGLEANQILFTYGATDSINIALLEMTNNLKKGRIVISSVEHPAVNEACKNINKSNWDIVSLPVDKYGVIQLDQVDKFLSPPTKILSLIWGQSEIGSLQPIKFISDICKRRNIQFHIDATQIFSQGILKLNDLYFDFISLSAHKFRGPKGVGMLISHNKHVICSNPNTNLFNRMYYQSGTTPVALVAGMSKAFENLKSNIHFNDNELIFQSNIVHDITKRIREELLRIPGLELLGHPSLRLPHHISLLLRDKNHFPINARTFVTALSNNGISISTGTACSLGSSKHSYVLEAIGLNRRYFNSSIRISIGDWIIEDNIDKITSVFNSTMSNFYSV